MISQRIRFGVALSGLALTFGCAIQPQFAPARVGEAFTPRTPPEKIEVFRSQTPTKKYFEIGSVSACCWASEEMVQALRTKASEIGGDALIGLDVGATGATIATVIRYE